jgi:predicted Rossmann fold nucleotide-binding protein DprA/Smf involved in DNA uptake
MNPKFVAVVGARNASKEQERKVRGIVKLLANVGHTLVSGGCYAGPDKWAEEEADKLKMNKLIIKPTVFTTIGYFARNKLIAEKSSIVFAFYGMNGRIGGTLNTVNEAKKLGKSVYEIFEDGRIISNEGCEELDPKLNEFSNLKMILEGC